MGILDVHEPLILLLGSERLFLLLTFGLHESSLKHLLGVLVLEAPVL